MTGSLRVFLSLFEMNLLFWALNACLSLIWILSPGGSLGHILYFFHTCVLFFCPPRSDSQRRANFKWPMEKSMSKHKTHLAYLHCTWCKTLSSSRLREIRQSRQACLTNFENVWRRAVVEFNQMSDEKLQMSGEAQKFFTYPAQVTTSLSNSENNKHRGHPLNFKQICISSNHYVKICT